MNARQLLKDRAATVRERALRPAAVRPLTLAALLLLFPGTPPATAQYTRPEIFRDIGIEQRLDAQAPLDLPFRDETGQPVMLRQYFGKRPVLLVLAYFNCPMLCPMVLDGMVKSLGDVHLTPGKDFEIVVLDFNPSESPQLAAAKKAQYVAQYGRPETATGWHFLTGEDPSILPVAKAVGFHYVYDPSSKQYAHATAIMILTPQGKVSRYFFGVQYLARDVRLGLVEASGNKIGSRADQVLLYCLHYDPSTGRYGVLIMRLIRIAGTITALAIGTALFIFFRRERQTRS